MFGEDLCLPSILLITTNGAYIELKIYVDNKGDDMNKVAKLKSIAKGIAATGVLGFGGGVLASTQVQNNKNSARSRKGWETRRLVKEAGLISHVTASGYLPKQLKKPKKAVATFSHSRPMSSADTKKGSSRAFVSRESMPISIEPEHAPRSKSMSQLGSKYV